MPRSAVDATRFTSTTPYASSKPQPAMNRPSAALPARQYCPAHETPQQKVQRLRAAANRARDAHLSTFDQLIIRGRVWADIAHRFTTWSLIGATMVAGVVTVYAVGDMVIYNRRKRAEFFATQKAHHVASLLDAKVATQNGSASEAQTELLKREHEEQSRAEQTKQEEMQGNGILTRSKLWLFSDLKREDETMRSNERRLGSEGSGERADRTGGASK